MHKLSAAQSRERQELQDYYAKLRLQHDKLQADLAKQGSIAAPNELQEHVIPSLFVPESTLITPRIAGIVLTPGRLVGSVQKASLQGFEETGKMAISATNTLLFSLNSGLQRAGEAGERLSSDLSPQRPSSG